VRLVAGDLVMWRRRRVLLSALTGLGLVALLALPASAAYPRPHHPPPAPRVQPHLGTGNSSYPDYLVAHGNFVYFEAQNATTGYALWRSDGTSGGTKDIYDDVDPRSLAWAGNKLFFEGDDPTYGEELWVSDGTHLNTHIVKDSVLGGSADIDEITAIGNRVFYAEDDGVHGWEPWVSDGTPGGTHIIKDIYPGSGSSFEQLPPQFHAVGGFVVFVATDIHHGTELWRTDGTKAGTTLLKDVDTGQFSSWPESLINFSGHVLFDAYDGVHGYEPWITDGTPAGTHILKNIGVGDHNGLYYDSNVPIFTRFGNDLFFEADDGIHNFELWKTDGTKAGTKLAVDMWPGPRSADPWTMMSNGQHLVVQAADEAHGYELHRTNGTPATTSFLKDVEPGPESSTNYLDPGDAARIGNKIVFQSWTSAYGWEPWVTDATPSGTHILKNIDPGSEWSDPGEFVFVQTTHGPRIFFEAYDPTDGNELWVTNGTSSHTHVIDIYP
jgi:ELWxxDGT repeat protein